MRILYLASNPAGADPLNIDREITELTLHAREEAAVAPVFTFLPGLEVERVPLELRRRKPDVLHLATHGSTETLSFRRQGDHVEIAVDGDMLASWLNPEIVPTLVYLNACNSASIAERLRRVVPITIGTTAPISNRAARAGAICFYDRLFAGLSVQHAFEAMVSMVRGLDQESAPMMYCRDGIDPAETILLRSTQLVATLLKPRPAKDGHFDLALGLNGCPSSTRQVIFFTDDDSFVGEETELEDDLSYLIREAPENGTVWTYDDAPWRAEGDHRLFAVGVTADGHCFTASAMLCDAIQRQYGESPAPEIQRALSVLRSRGTSRTTT